MSDTPKDALSESEYENWRATIKSHAPGWICDATGESLIRDLAEYAQHTLECEGGHRHCTCGLSALLDRVPKSETKER